MYIETDKDLQTFEEEMLKCSIPGVLTFHKEIRNGVPMFYYDITQKKTLREHLKQSRLDVKTICFILRNLIQIMKEMRDFLLEASNCLISTDYIYLGDGGTTVWLCYYLGYEVPVQQQLLAMLEDWMRIVDYKDREAVKLVYELFHQAGQDTCTYSQIIGVVEQAESEILNLPKDFNELLKEEHCSMEEVVHDPRVIAAKETLAGEKEVLYYPASNYVKLGVGAAAGAAIVITCIKTGICNNVYGNVDIMKMLCIMIIVFAGIVYTAVKLFGKEQRHSKMVPVYHEISVHDTLGEEWIPKGIERSGESDIDEKYKEGTEDDVQQFSKNSYDKYKDLMSGQRVGLRVEQMNIADTMEEEETQILYEEKTEILTRLPSLVLVPEYEGGEAVDIGTSELIIGSSKLKAGHCIPYKTISRCHAKFFCRDNTFYLEDLQSTNGTFINNKRCCKGEEYIIEDGDCIQFAEYTYHVRGTKSAI